MIAEATISLEESSTATFNDLNSLYSSIKTSLKSYIEASLDPPKRKKAKLTSAQTLISVILSSKSSIPFDSIDSLIASLQHQLTLLKQSEEKSKKEIASLKQCLQTRMTEKYNGSSLEDAKVNKLKRRLRNRESDYKSRELDYLFCINDQSNRIKALQMQTLLFDEADLKKVKLFPYLMQTTDSGVRANTQRRDESRNVTKPVTVSNTISSIRNKRRGLTEGNEDLNEKVFLSERVKKDNARRVMRDYHELKEAKSQKDLIHFKLYQNNRFTRKAFQFNNLLQISSMTNGQKKGNLFRAINLMKKPVVTSYGLH